MPKIYVVLEYGDQFLPDEVNEEIKKIWDSHDDAGHSWYYKWWRGEDEHDYPAIASYLKKNSIESDVLLLFDW